MSTNEENIFDKPPDMTINEVVASNNSSVQRGAFKPEEFKDVGALNDKLKALLEYARKLEEAAKNNLNKLNQPQHQPGQQVSTSRVNTISTSRVSTIRII